MPSKADRRGKSGFRQKKRRFTGNQFTKEEPCDPSPVVSASSKKVKLDGCGAKLDESTADNGYRIINIDILCQELSKFLKCHSCGSSAVLKERVVYGLASELSIECVECPSTTHFKTSPLVDSSFREYEVNSRIVYTMRTLGLGLRGVKNFCLAMDLPPPLSQKPYERILEKIKIASSTVATQSMKEAAAEESSLTNCEDICVSGDGTWKTRGHTSKVGVCSVIGDRTGKVLDVEVLSSYCRGCCVWKGVRRGPKYDKWMKKHKKICRVNHTGSSGKMEVDGMKKIFLRSVADRKVKYVKYIGDGDTRTYPEISKIVPYPVEKVECVGHIQKRMGARLRKLKTSQRGKKLEDGKSLGGKNRLTDARIDKFTVYYGNAIRENCGSLNDMQQAIWAIYCHYSSTDSNPLHHFCPSGDKTWCGFKKAEATNSPYHHENAIPTSVMKFIKPVFADLANRTLLRKCLGGKTQNANESFNSTIWKYCPKTSGASRLVVDIAVNEAVTVFNDGMVGRLNIMKKLGFTLGRFSRVSATVADFSRVKAAEVKATSATLEARRANRMRNKARNEHLAAVEGVQYQAGLC